jgi:hypothetical protein
MTNVLIGIIGVLLFIGLALAGALFLGPRFQQAQRNSKAMTLTQMASQIVVAMEIKRNEDGTPMPARQSMRVLSQNSYLKTVPVNPYLGEGGWPFRALYSHDLHSPYYYADVVFLSIGHGEDAPAVCRSINKQGHDGGDEIPTLPLSSGSDIGPAMTKPSGCFRMHDVGVPGEAAPGDFVVYSRI